MSVFKNSDIRYSIKEVFCKLFIHLWIDIMPYTKVDFELNVLNWDQLEDTINIPISRFDCSKFKPIKKFVINFISNETHTLNVKGKEEKAKIRFLNTLLNMSKKMLELGFFEDLYEINMIVRRLKTVLLGSFKHYNTMALHINRLTAK